MEVLWDSAGTRQSATDGASQDYDLCTTRPTQPPRKIQSLPRCHTVRKTPSTSSTHSRWKKRTHSFVFLLMHQFQTSSHLIWINTKQEERLAGVSLRSDWSKEQQAWMNKILKFKTFSSTSKSSTVRGQTKQITAEQNVLGQLVLVVDHNISLDVLWVKAMLLHFFNGDISWAEKPSHSSNPYAIDRNALFLAQVTLPTTCRTPISSASNKPLWRIHTNNPDSISAAEWKRQESISPFHLIRRMFHGTSRPVKKMSVTKWASQDSLWRNGWKTSAPAN